MKTYKSGTSIIEVLLALFIAGLALTFSTYLFGYLQRERRLLDQERSALYYAEKFSYHYFNSTSEQRQEYMDNPDKVMNFMEYGLPEYVYLELFVPQEHSEYIILQSYQVRDNVKKKIIEVPLYAE